MGQKHNFSDALILKEKKEKFQIYYNRELIQYIYIKLLKDKKSPFLALFTSSRYLSFLKFVRHNELLFLWASSLRTEKTTKSNLRAGVLKLMQTGHTRPQHPDPEPKDTSETNWSICIISLKPPDLQLTAMTTHLQPLPVFDPINTHSPSPSGLVHFSAPSPFPFLGK